MTYWIYLLFVLTKFGIVLAVILGFCVLLALIRHL